MATVAIADIDERAHPGENPADYVMRLAQAKAARVAEWFPGAVVLGADTIVVQDGRLLGKPKDRNDAFSMWQAMSGKSHQVLTAVAVVQGKEAECRLSSSEVVMARITPEAMDAYWKTGEPADKAGGYAIQGLAARWIREIHGSYSGIMGLPLFETAELLNRAGIHPSP